MSLVTDLIVRPASRLGAAAQNALEVARFGGLETGEEASPYTVVTEQRNYRLRRYFAEDGAPAPDRPPMLLVPPLMLAADVWDVAPSTSAVAALHDNGIDPWVVDFGAPEHEEGGLERTLTDHVVAVSDAVDRVRAAVGRDIHLGGYSQGGMFCYQTAAFRRSAGLASLVTFGSPVDTKGALPFGIPEQVAVRGAAFLADHVLGRSSVPAWVSRTGFRLLDPVKSVRQRIDFLMQLHDREALLPRERQRQFLEAGGWVAWPGPALAEFVAQFVAHNRMLSGGFVIEERLVTLADITCPVLTVVGEVDEIAPLAAVRAVRRAAPRADVYELLLRAGHFGLVVGSSATRSTWPAVAGWAHWSEGGGERPEAIVPVDGDRAEPAAQVGTRVSVGAELVAGLGLGVARSVVETAARTVTTARLLTEEAARQLPRLTRLERIQPGTRISLGLLLDEHARSAPDAVFFLYEGRAYSHGAVKQRIDSVARGLISVGVRQGEHVGVLMGTRPSALTVVAALSRLGAVAVLLRPEGSVAREAELGQVRRIVADPDLADRARDAGAAELLVLGGGGEPRELAADVVDMERIDPDAVSIPSWYRSNPGRARDLAFVLFTGEGERTQASRILNARWVLSAFGTASSAALSAADTVYSQTPIHHSSGLLMSLGGAIAGGARLALGGRFDPSTFWEEVRRYGATVVSYTWTMLRDLVEAPPLPAERHHPVRLFIGSGMPPGLWRRVTGRFAPAGVLEFYASTDGDAVLVNLSGAKPGAKGRPLPGSAEVAIAAYDHETEGLMEGSDGFAVRCADDEVGMLLARVRRDTPGPSATKIPLRGVFAPDDAWVATGDLFRRDADGDHWHVGHVTALVRTARGPVASVPIQDAIDDLDAVDLAVAYGVTGPGGTQIPVAAVTLRRGAKLAPQELARSLSGLPEHERPMVVHVVREIALTTWYRPLTAKLSEAGLPRAGRRAFYRDGAEYRPLTAAARDKVARGEVG